MFDWKIWITRNESNRPYDVWLLRITFENALKLIEFLAKLVWSTLLTIISMPDVNLFELWWF